MKLVIYNFLFALFFMPSLWASETQFKKPSEELQYYKNKYPSESSVLVKKTMLVELKLLDDKIEAWTHNYEERIILNEQGNVFNNRTISFSEFYPLINLEAKTLVPEKGKYKSLKVEDFKEVTNFDNSIFHDGVKEKQFYFQGLQPGAKTIVEYKHKITDIKLLNGFFFISNSPLEMVELKIICDKAIELEQKTFSIDDLDLIYQTEFKKGKNYHIWQAMNVSKIESFSGSPNVAYYAPHIHFYVKSVTVNSEKRIILEQPKDLHNWYYSITKNLRTKSEDSELQRLVDSLVSGVNSETQKAKIIFHWVQDNVKYIAFEEGLGGFVPRASNLVLERKFGDCKDMANLIYSMLKLADVPAYLTWIGSRKIPYEYETLPTPATDNHMIAAYESETGYVFLDATNNLVNFGMPSEFIQGKEALISKGENEFEIVKVPVVNAIENCVYDSTLLQINLIDKSIEGKAFIDYSGYQKNKLERILSLTEEAKWLEEFDDLLRVGNNKFNLLDITPQRVNVRDSSLMLSYDYKLYDYLKSYNNELYVNLNLDKVFSDLKFEKNRNVAFKADYKSYLKRIIELEIPESYSVDYLPENSHFGNEYFSYSLSYSILNNKVSLTSIIELNFLMLEVDQFEEWNTMIEQLAEAYSEVLILKKNQHD